MRPFWVMFAPSEKAGPLKAACIEAESLGEARLMATSIAGQVVSAVEILPYPARPQIGVVSGMPALCWQPSVCAGKGACPRAKACSS